MLQKFKAWIDDFSSSVGTHQHTNAYILLKWIADLREFLLLTSSAKKKIGLIDYNSITADNMQNNL